MKLNGGRWKIFIRSYTEVILKLNGGMRKLEKLEEVREVKEVREVREVREVKEVERKFR